MVELSEIKRGLQSSTLKHRKEAVKQLELQLSSPRFLRQLDINTVKLWPEDKIQLLSWPGLVDTYLNYMHKEVTEHKKQLDATAIKVFKTIFTAADNADRCGPGRNNLLRRAGSAFDKLGKMLEVAPEGEGLGTPLGKEIASVLLKVLLPNLAYCQRATVESFQGLVEEVMLRFEALQQQIDDLRVKTAQQAAAATATGRLAPAARGAGAPSAAAMQQEMFIITNLLTGLLSGVPGQLVSAFVVDVVSFLAQSLNWMDKQGEYGRTSRQLMACLNGLLLSYGADLRPNLPSTHKVINSYVKHAWTAHTSVPVKDGVMCFCRLSLALGSMPTAGSGVLLNDVLRLVTGDINTPAFAWDLHNNKQHQQLAPLAASLYYHAAFTAAAGSTASSSGPATSSGPAATAAAAPEVGSCGSTGDGLGAQTQGTGKRRASSAEAGATPAAAKTAARGGGVSGDDGSSDDEVLQLPRKRSRVLGPAGQLLMHLQADPDRWGPVVALLLHQHGPLVPPAFLAALQQQLTTTVTRCIAALSHQDSQAAAGSSGAAGALAAGGLDRRSASPAVAAGTAAGAAAGVRGAQQLQQQLLWVCRCLCELALCWPAVLHPLAAAGNRDCAGSSAPSCLAAGVNWEAAGAAYNSSEGSCSQQPWQRADAAAAHTTCSSSWQQLWESCVGTLAAGQQQLSAHPAVQESMTWLLHVLVAHKLVQLPSKAAVLLKLHRFWLPAQEGSAGELHYNPEQQVVLTEAQLALLLSLCMGQHVSSQKEMDLRQQLLQACLSTAEAWSSGSNRRASRHSTGARAGSMAPPAPAAAPSTATLGKTLPDLLLPAMLGLLGAPSLPTPSLNGAPAAATMASTAAAKLAATQIAWSFSAGKAGNPVTAAVTAAAAAGDWADSALGRGSGSSGAGVVWYAAADGWWGANQQLEAQLAGLETGLDTLRRQLATQQLQQLLAAACAADASTASAAGPAASTAEHALSPKEAAGILVGYEPDGSVREGAAPPAEGSSDAGWWKCWCRLADDAADHLCNALLPFTAAGQDNEAGHPWDASQETLAAADGGPASAATDPVKQLSYLLLLLNASVSLPCIAALQFSLHQQQSQQLDLEKTREKQLHGLDADPQQAAQDQEQQQGARQEMFCGLRFSQHPEQHQQLQQMVMEAGIKAGQLLADNLQQLPCHAGSTWLQQLMHLGASLARIQALMTALPTAHGPDNSKVKYQMLAAASFLAEVVKVLERVTSQAAATASAEPDEDMDGAGGGADPDFDDDFMDVAPAHNRQGAAQQPAMSMMGTPAASFRPTQGGSFTASRPPAAAAGPVSTAGTSGPAVHVGGGLAGFSGRAQTGLGNTSAIFSPALLSTQSSSGYNSRSRSQPGFAVGGLGEGLSGLAGAEGAGLRVFAALSPAYGDTAQALMRLWVHMAGLTGWAPPEALLQAVVETATTAVCAGGWSHLQQLFGLMKGSHTLLSAQKVPSSTSHLITRLLQQVAAAAAAVGLRLDVPCALPESQASQEVAELPSQEEPGAGYGTTYLSVMCDIFGDVQRRLGAKHDRAAAESQLPQSTQLQLGLTTLALLQLQPQAGYTTTAQHAEALPTWRQHCLLRLLSSPSSALRARAGPLTAALLTALAAAASPAAAFANSDNCGSALRCLSIAEFVKVAVAEISGYLFLQDSAIPTSAQANRAGRRQAALRQMGAAGPAVATAKQEWDATNREAQQDAMAWEAAAVQLADLAHATTAAACVALQQQEPPNVLDAHLLLLLMRHTASVQLLPADALPAHAAGIPVSGSNSQAGSSGHGSSARARALSVAATALDMMAAQQHYGSRCAYLQFHCRAWAKEWGAAACTAQQLLAISTIICPMVSGAGSEALPSSAPALDAAAAAPPPGADATEGAGGAKLLLQAYGSALSFWSIFYGATDELAVLAAAAGLEEAALLQVYTHELCSCVYPILKVPELKQATDRFRTKLPSTAEHLTQEDSYGLVYSMFEISLPVLPSTGQQQQPPGLRLDVTLPFITQPVADRGLGQLAKLWDSNNWLLALPFTAAGVQVLLLKAHRSLEAAAHPLHKLQRMGQLQCLVRQLPADRLQSPAVARSLVSMLLQNLQVPELQGACCSCLEQLLAALFAVLPAVFNEQGHSVGHMQDTKKQALTAKQQQQQAQQQAHEELVKALLQELLPPVVAALVQCVETAAGGLQLRQQQQLWTMQHSTAAAAASALGLGRSAGGVAPVDLPSAFAPVSLLLSISLSMFTKGMGLLLDLLPPLPVLAAAAARQGWNALDITHLIPWFVQRAAGMTSSSRQRSAQQLLSRLRRYPGQVYGLKSEMWRDAGIPAQILVHPGNSEIKRFANDNDRCELAPYPSVVTASFELARLGAELCDAHVMQLAAELLALIGPMDPDVITLDHCAAADLYSSVGGYSSTRRSAVTKSSSSHADKTAFPLKAVLALLADSLFDQQPQVVSTAQDTLGTLVSVLDADTLQHILQPPAVDHRAVDQDKPKRAEALLLQSYVGTYISSQGDSPSTAPAPAAVAAALEAAPSADLWSPSGKPYKQWLCSLASTLLRACGGVQDTAAATAVARRTGRSAAAGASVPVTTAVLALLADAAAISPSLAELLLPHAVLKLCESDHSGADVPGAGSQGWAARLGAAAAEGLQLDSLTGSAAATWRADASWGGAGAGVAADQFSDTEKGTGSTAGVDTRCYSALLTCLEHNRSINQMALASMPLDPAPAAVAWQRCFCLHLDYLAVAAAAMAVKAYFTAMLYVEQWCFEQQQGGMNPFQGAVADSSIMQLQQLAGLATSTADAGAANGLNSAQQAVQQHQQQLLQQLLLELYSNVNEPDGVYAVVAAFGSPASQLQLLQHEQQWAAVLGGQDALLQAAVLQPAQQQGRSAHVTGALTALQRLGCPATAQQCIAGALQQQQQQQQQQLTHLQQVNTYLVLPGSHAEQARSQQLQQQQVQQLQEAQQEIAWRLSDWGLASSLNPAAAGQPGFGGGYGPQGSAPASAALSLPTAAGQQGSGFHAAVLAALSALQQRDQEGFTAQVSSAQHDCVLRLARSSAQSAAAVNPLLVQLQMLQMLARGLLVRKSSPAAPPTDWPAKAAKAFLEALSPLQIKDDLMAPQAAENLSDISFELSDHVLSLQGALSKALKRPDALLATLQATMKVARKAGQVNFAAAALQQLQETLHQAVLGARASHGVLGLGLPAASAAGCNGVQLPGWIQRAVAAESGWPLEAVKIRWLQGQHQAALKELKTLAVGLERQLASMYAAAEAAGSTTIPEKHAMSDVCCALMQARMLLGKWLAAGEGSTSNIQGAMQQLQSAAGLAPAVRRTNLFHVCGDMKELHSRVCYQLAVCADQHYQMLDAQMASPEFQKQQQVLRTKEQLFEQLKSAVEATKNWGRQVASKQQSAKQAHAQVLRRYGETQRQVDLDRQALTQLQDSHLQYLTTALSAYRDCVAAGDKHDLQVVYRMCGLWFRHSDVMAVNQVMQQTFQQVPSAKFVPLVYQIASRLDNTQTPFQVVLMDALFQLARDHIYHTLYPLIALSNGDTEGGDPAAKNAHLRHETNTARVAAASALLQRIRAVQPLQPVVDDMTAQVTDLIGMTLQVHKALPRGPGNQVAVDQYTMPANFRRRLKSLRHAPPICYSLPLDTTRRYEDMPYVAEIDSTVKIAGGINTPLIIRTTDDSGRTQRQLCKCNDDLRQDAVMQQFFGLVDTLLKGSPASKQRRLGYRTYRVVPCSPLVGVLEWVEGTTPLTEYLLGSRDTQPPYSGGASGRYHKPGGVNWMECYLRIDKAQPKDLKNTFLYCCKHFPPVFRQFFLEAFPHPSDWFEARTRYTRSTAVASMSGAVIGLGDRHLGNILLDMHSAEVVHIDLGIAFEQGLFLQTAERVPFRLTANIVDGMGAAGVEGTFRRCCETTLQVLREHQDALLTVVQVVLHDPLYRWQMTPIKAGRKQLDPMAAQQDAADASAAAGDGAGAAAGVGGAGSSTVVAVSSGGLGNADAERAVLRVKQKLQGQDVEGGAALSVAAQVAAMLQAARDPENLSRMFKGWAPWV